MGVVPDRCCHSRSAVRTLAAAPHVAATSESVLTLHCLWNVGYWKIEITTGTEAALQSRKNKSKMARTRSHLRCARRQSRSGAFHDVLHAAAQHVALRQPLPGRPSTTRMAWSTRRNSPAACNSSPACSGVSSSLSSSASSRCGKLLSGGRQRRARLQHAHQEIKVVEAAGAGLEALRRAPESAIRLRMDRSSGTKPGEAAKRLRSPFSASVGLLGETAPFRRSSAACQMQASPRPWPRSQSIAQAAARMPPVRPRCRADAAGCLPRSPSPPACSPTTSPPGNARTAPPLRSRIPRCAKTPDPHRRARPVRRSPDVPRQRPQSPPAHPPRSAPAAISGRSSASARAESPTPACPSSSVRPTERRVRAARLNPQLVGDRISRSPARRVGRARQCPPDGAPEYP